MATTIRRFLAVISSTRTKDKGFIFAKGVEMDREEYFVHVSGVRDEELWLALTVGDGISCEVETTPKGYRAHSVQRATVQEQAAIDATGITEDVVNHGNR